MEEVSGAIDVLDVVVVTMTGVLVDTDVERVWVEVTGAADVVEEVALVLCVVEIVEPCIVEEDVVTAGAVVVWAFDAVWLVAFVVPALLLTLLVLD